MKRGCSNAAAEDAVRQAEGMARFEVDVVAEETYCRTPACGNVAFGSWMQEAASGRSPSTENFRRSLAENPAVGRR